MVDYVKGGIVTLSVGGRRMEVTYMVPKENVECKKEVKHYNRAKGKHKHPWYLSNKW